MGQVLPCGSGQNPAKQAAVAAGMPWEIEALTINKVCGSALKAVMLAAQAIQTGDADVVHPQYHINGEILEYDMNTQHFRGSGGDNNGRIRIRMAPEVVPGNEPEGEEVAGEESSPGEAG